MTDPVNPAYTFDYSAMRAYAVANGLTVREDYIAFSDPQFSFAGLTQPQVDTMGKIWASLMTHTLDRKQYTVIGRIKFALYWLGFGKSVKSMAV